MKIIFCGGGSAGHVTPALAIAEEIKKTHSTAEILFIGRDGGFENGMVKKAGLPMQYIKIGGLQRKFTVKNIKNAINALKAVNRCKKIISDFSPDVVVGTGGYVCWPVLHAATSLKIPTVIHESNRAPGLTTRLVSKKCTEVLLNHENTANDLKRKDNVRVIGNPLRSDFNTIRKSEARRRLRINKDDIYIVSFGGSIGAQRMNDVILKIIKEESQNANIKHLHATGKRYYEKDDIQSAKQSNYKIVPYIDDMPIHLCAADIVICRSGAMTLSEIALTGAAAILIPSPNVSENHQYKNAKALADEGACILIEESELTEKVLKDKISELARDEEKRKELGKRIKKFATKNASALAAQSIIKIAESSSSASNFLAI